MTAVEDHIAIATLLARYARGIDRVDVPLIKSAFWPDATDDHGTFCGNAHDFADYLGRSLLNYAASSHVISNIIVDLRGDSAASECCVTAVHFVDADGENVKFSLGGRYLDRFERRGGEWRISARVFIMDWLDLPEKLERLRPHLQKIKARGERAPADLSYGHFLQAETQ